MSTSLAFPHSIAVMPGQYDAFFKWVHSDHYNAQTDPDDATLVALIDVTDDLQAEFKADMLPPDPVPPVRWYIIHWNDQGVLDAFAYNNKAEALADLRPYLEDSLYGEDPIDIDAEASLSGSIKVLSTDKPQRVIATATAVVEVSGGPVLASEVVTAGLDALHESRGSLFGYGIQGLPGDREILTAGRYTVYANRD